MLGPTDERTPPMTPQLALRVALVGGVALMLFGVIFFRLWVVQVLTGSKYVAQAQSNVVQHLPVVAPRGEVVDANDTPLVQSVEVPAIQIAPRALPVPVNIYNLQSHAAKDYAVYDRLARLLGLSTKPGTCRYTIYWQAHHHVDYNVKLAPVPCRVAMSVSQSPLANAPIKTNVQPAIQDYVAERISEFPGVLYQDTYVRKYALGTAGAQVLGMTQQISPTEVGTKHYKGIASGNIVGQSGIEAAYNWALQGVNGWEGVKVDSQGQFEGYSRGMAPQQGDTLKLSMNAQLEKVGQRSLAESIAQHGGTGGAFVAMDPQNGQIYAIGSSPSYNPSKVSPTISTKEWNFLRNKANNYPLLDRAIAGVGADGSTFKVITAVAALESGRWGLDQVYDDNNCYIPPGSSPGTPCKHNAGGSVYGPVSLVTAIQDSVDTFFYNLGGLTNTGPTHPQGGPLQAWARKFGVGRPTGVDIPGEATGTLPTPAWVASRIKLEEQCDAATGQFRYTNGTINASHIPSGAASIGWHRSPKHAPGGCEIAIMPPEYWTVGDNVNTAVGQGDDQLTPLQLAVVYSALENGGNIVTPHLAEAIQSQTGSMVSKIDPPIRRHLHIESDYLAAIQQGLYNAAHDAGGTSADVMGNFPKPVYGKTGTAQYGTASQIATNTESDYAWYACYVPASATSKPITVVVWVEKGGFGDVAAAPVARQILSQWFLGKPGQFKSGVSVDL